ncbi:MAG: hypothetical protein BWY57_01321 [Betaproteobacteria bacterium ADurb.Bin341]|nr:MAG: hypothetical protein BWY57_01321 [Betaproteobacteria bacterium ADurb.Bin341]
MHSGGIKRIVAVGNAQKTGRLLKRLVAQARHFFQRLTVGERAVRVAEGHDIAGQRGVEAGNAGQKGNGGGIDVDADGIDAILDHGIQTAGQLRLRHIVLVLADANRFRLDLDQFGQRVLQAAGNRHGATQADIKFRKFTGGEFRGGIDRSAGFRDDDLGQLQFRVFLHQVLHQLVGFAAGRAVADGDQFNFEFGADFGQRVERAVPVVARLMRVNGGGAEQFAGAVDDGQLAAGADARIEAEHRFGAGRSGQQQVFQITGKDADGFFFSTFAQVVH